MLALVSGSPSAVRMASDQASWFWPVGVWYSAVACGVSEPEPELEAGADDADDAVLTGVATGREVAVGVTAAMAGAVGVAVGLALAWAAGCLRGLACRPAALSGSVALA